MRKLIVSIHSTANNIVTGPPQGDETDFMRWAQPGIDESVEKFLASLDGVDTMVLGRGTYEDLVRKWPTVADWPQVTDVALRIGEKINSARKFVVTSQSVDSLAWGVHEPATPVAGRDVELFFRQLKEADGGDIITFGSPVLVQALTNASLVDEYQIIVHPVVMHEGRRLFDNLEGRTDLRLVDVARLPGGAMMVTYAPAGGNHQ